MTDFQVSHGIFGFIPMNHSTHLQDCPNDIFGLISMNDQAHLQDYHSGIIGFIPMNHQAYLQDCHDGMFKDHLMTFFNFTLISLIWMLKNEMSS